VQQEVTSFCPPPLKISVGCVANPRGRNG